MGQRKQGELQWWSLSIDVTVDEALEAWAPAVVPDLWDADTFPPSAVASLAAQLWDLNEPELDAASENTWTLYQTLHPMRL